MVCALSASPTLGIFMNRIYGEYRFPKQMLDRQEYDGHLSIHDDRMAEDLGFSGAPIEGPTHFSQFAPLLHRLFGDIWFEMGCLSAHYQNMVVDGEEVRVFAEPQGSHSAPITIGAEKRDGTPVLTGTASVGPDFGKTEIDHRLARLKPSEQLVILADLTVGQQGAANPEDVVMDFDQHMGPMYPFSLNQKLARITERHPYYTSSDNPWGRPIIPLEMVSVLVQYSSGRAGFRARGPSIGLFAGQEIRMINGPLFVNHPYQLEREIVALSESRRTESNWIKTSIFDAGTRELVAETILNSAVLKDSYADYASDAATLGKN